MFLDYVNGVPSKLPVLDALIDRAGPQGDIEIITSMLSIAEVAYGRLDQTSRALDPAVEARIDAMWNDPIIKQVEVHKTIALAARDLVRDARRAGVALKGADAIHLATAAHMQVAEFHTYDTRLFKHAARVGIPILEPATAQPRLPGT